MTEPVSQLPAVLWNAFQSAIAAALQDYSAGVVLLVLAVIALFALLQHSWKARLRDKDREIRRIADQRRILEETLLRKRLGTGLDDDPEE